MTRGPSPAPAARVRWLWCVALLPALVGGAACGDRVAASLSARTFVLERSIDGCDPADEGCSWIRIEGVVLQPIQRPAVAAIQHRLDLALRTPILAPEPAESLEAMVEDFLREYREFRRQAPAVATAWSFERRVELLWSGRHVASFAVQERSFLGGAHPNSSTTYHVFSTRDGHELQLAELFVPGFEPELRRIAEEAFRRHHGLTQDDSLEDAGFWFDGGFDLPVNWAVTELGLVLHYNPYEVAPYALGPTHLVIARDRLRSLIDETGPWGR